MSSIELKDALDKFQAIHEEGESEFFLFAAAVAVLKWLRQEKELTCLAESGGKAVWARWVTLNNMMLQSILTDKDGDYVGDKMNEAMPVALKVSSLAFVEDVPFRSFIKDIGVSGAGRLISPEESGDLITYLLTFLEILKENESGDLIEKYERDIHDICRTQLDGEEILDEAKGIANNIYLENKEVLKDYVPLAENN